MARASKTSKRERSALLEVPVFALQRLGGVSRGVVHRSLAEEGLSARWHFLLLCLHEHGALSQRELADYLFVDSSDLVKQLDELERSGQLQRAPDPADRRRHLVSITALGVASLRRGERIVQQATDSVLAGLDKDQRAALHALVSQALAALDPAGS